MKPADQTSSELDFEAALKTLEALVEKLESGDSSLDETLQQFEQGVSLSRRCHSLLEQAQKRVELLSQVEDESSAEPFSPEEQSSERSD